MRNIIDAWPAITAAAAHRTPLLMLDFDGTLAPIAATPDDAALSGDTRSALMRCSLLMPVCIVSGRAMNDLQRRIDIASLTLVANHGAERRVNGAYEAEPVSRDARRSLMRLRHALESVSAAFPGTMIEDKEYSVVFHFRRTPAASLICLKMQLYTALDEARAEGIVVTENERSLEFRVSGLRNKGDAVRLIMREHHGWRHDMLPFFIGDERTDEDAFRALPRGITIRVGYARESAARYYVDDQSQVSCLLNDLAQACERCMLVA